MKKITVILMFIFFALSFSAQIGPWRHFKAVTDTFTVFAGDTLNIDPGTNIRLGPDALINIYGVVKSNGTSTDPVVFSALSSVEPWWQGINISNSSASERSVFNYTIFNRIRSDNDDGSININSSSVDFNYCRFKYNSTPYSGGAVYIDSGDINFFGCLFVNNHALYGGAIHIYNNSADAASSVDVRKSGFFFNSAESGGAVYIEDSDGSLHEMNVIVDYCGFFNNKTELGFGGGLMIDCLSNLSLNLDHCRIQFNSSDTAGGGIYTRFNEMYSQPVLPVSFSNLLVTQNDSPDGGGIYFDTGFTTNPDNIDFINNTIAYNVITGNKKLPGGGGIHLVSNSNYPVIKNSILWGNQGANSPSDDQFLISDPGSPLISDVFHFCNIEGGHDTGSDGISTDPKFIRPPGLLNLNFRNKDRYDYHLSILSPSIDAGDTATVCNEPNSIIVNQGAYGNTIEARQPLSSANSINAANSSIIDVPDDDVTVLDFSLSKQKEYNFSKITMGSGSELHLKGSSLATINIDTLRTFSISNQKFDQNRVIIQKAVDNTGDLSVQDLNISSLVSLNGADFSDLRLKLARNPKKNTDLKVDMNDCNINSSSAATGYGISVYDASTVNIENCTIDNFNNGIEVKNSVKGHKASGRISNNSVTFDPDVASKVQQIGIDVEDSQIDIEYNTVNGGSNGEVCIQMKASSGRISNNSVTFDADVASKLLEGRIGINILPGSDVTIENNSIWSLDSTSSQLSGINIDSSKANISYNSINLKEAGTLDIRNGIALNNVLEGTYVYNNTVYNPKKGIANTPADARVDVINNIFWHEGTAFAAVSDTTNLTLLNNIVEDMSNIGGSGNFSSDPLCIDPSINDLIVSTSSPCINSGFTVSGFHIPDSTYYGSAPDIGAFEYYEMTVTAPGNVTVSVTDSTFAFGWDAVPDASVYYIYSADDPYSDFTKTDSVSATFWSCGLDSVRKFFYITADDTSSKSAGNFSGINSKLRNMHDIKKEPSIIIKKKKILLKNSSLSR